MRYFRNSFLNWRKTDILQHKYATKGNLSLFLGMSQAPL